MKKTLQIIGPFITNYSFARVNRGLAKALSEVQDEYDIFLYQDKEKIDKWPTEQDLEKFPYIKKLWSPEEKQTDVAIYFDFPKEGIVPHGFKDIPAKTKIYYVAWEETVFPQKWIQEINDHIHGVMVTSTFVKDIMRNNGVKVPISVVWNGIDSGMLVPHTEAYPLKTKKKFKFLHISSARKRKGMDVLLQAYFSAFTKDDDVCLVIKSFPSPDNLVNELLQELQTDNSPEVEHIFSPDVSDQDMVNLIHSTHCSVYPSRAEGFGLPIAEAMWHEQPVIATNYSAYLDFLDEDSGFLIDYTLVDANESEAVNIGAKWAEPSMSDLAAKMRFVYEQYDSELVQDKIARAKESANRLVWGNAAKKTRDFVSDVEAITELKQKNAAVISFLNTDDGLANYTKQLYSKIELSFREFYYLSNSDIDARTELDAENVIRNWESGAEQFETLLQFVDEKHIDFVHIQYHSGVNFSTQALDTLISQLKQKNCSVFVTPHAISGPNFSIWDQSQNLGDAQAIFVHNKQDFDAAPIQNKILFPHPRDIYKKRNKESLRKKLHLDLFSPIIATHGKLVLQKIDIPAVLQAVHLLQKKYPNILYLVVNAVVASNVSAQSDFETIKSRAIELGIERNVVFIPEFVSADQAFTLLQAADVAVFPYHEVGEAAGDAITKSLAVGTPAIATDIKMFAEFTDTEVLKIKRFDATDIADAVELLLNDAGMCDSLIQNAYAKLESISYEKMAVRMLGEYSK